MKTTKPAGPANATIESHTGVDTGRVTQQPARPLELDLLNMFIGRWMTEGDTIAQGDTPCVPIVASDVYQWLPGNHFVMHPAYGRIGDIGVGGLEVIGFDPTTRQYQCHFFDSQGNTTRQTLSFRDGTWTWQGTHARCTGVFTDSGRTLTARHERSDDGEQWVPSMTVVLKRID
jgi:uncharacterized protein DUF1579